MLAEFHKVGNSDRLKSLASGDAILSAVALSI